MRDVKADIFELTPIQKHTISPLYGHPHRIIILARKEHAQKAIRAKHPTNDHTLWICIGDVFLLLCLRRLDCTLKQLGTAENSPEKAVFSADELADQITEIPVYLRKSNGVTPE